MIVMLLVAGISAYMAECKERANGNYSITVIYSCVFVVGNPIKLTLDDDLYFEALSLK
jgi:hypothetical protein